MVDAVEKHLIELEHKYWNAIQAKDTETALSLTDDPCIVAGAQGVAQLTHEDFRGMLGCATYTLDRFELKDPKVRLLSDSVAVVAYTAHEEVTLEGKSITLDAAETSTWVKRGDRWLCSMHAEAIHGDAFGRDRKSEAPESSAA